MRKESESLRWTFYNKIHAITPSHPNVDYKLACEAWCEVTGASWAWMWLADRLPGITELQLVCGHAAKGELPIPPNLAVTNTNSVAAFCLSEGRPQFVNDLKKWRGGLEAEFKVGLADFLHEKGCYSFLCVPLVAHSTSAASKAKWNAHAHGALCLHFPRQGKVFLHTPQALLLMARLTTQLLEASHHAQQRKLFMGLSDIAIRHVGAVGESAIERRRAYSGEVIELIKKELNVDGISIFMEDPMRSCVECIATTGLEDNRGKKVANVAHATYQPGEGLTGQCYLNGTPFISQSHMMAGAGPARFVEIVEGGDSYQPAAALYPIPRMLTRAAHDREPLASGVLRLVRHYSPFFPKRRLKFDSLRLATLELVAREVATVLTGMTASIQKERMLKSVQHDNGAALTILTDLLESSERRSKSRAKPGLICLTSEDEEDLRFTLLLLQNINHDILSGAFGEEDFEPELVDVFKLTKRLASLISRHSRSKLGGKITIYPSPYPPKLFVDRFMIGRTILNLLDNALKFSNSGEDVKVIVGTDASSVFIDVINFGTGVDKNDVQRIFLPGFRGKCTNATKGSGMGLSVAKQMISKHHGQLLLVRASGPTIFRLVLPLILQNRHKTSGL